MEPRLDRCLQIIEHRTPLLPARRDHRPDPLTPPIPRFAPRPLRHQPVEHHEPDRLFRQVVRRLHSRLREEPEITLPMLLEPNPQVEPVLSLRHPVLSATQHLHPRRLRLALEHRWREVLPPVDHREQLPQRLTQPLPKSTRPQIGQRGQELHIPDQMRQTELEQYAELALVATIGREVVTDQDSIELLAQDLNEHLSTAGRVDLEQGVQAGAEAPGPHPRAVLPMAGLIDVESRLRREVLEQFRIRSLQGGADLTEDLDQLAPRDGHPDDIAEELADGRERGVAGPLEIGDESGQPRSDQATAFDGQGERGIAQLLAVGAPPRVTAMLFDRQRHLMDLDLLDDARGGGGGLQAVSAAGAEEQDVVVRSAVDLLRWEQDTLVFGVSGLSTDAALVLALRRWRLGRLDDVGGRGLGRGRGVLRGRGELCLQLGEGNLEGLQLRLLGLELRLEGVQLRLQPLAIRARVCGSGSHSGLFYIPPCPRQYPRELMCPKAHTSHTIQSVTALL